MTPATLALIATLAAAQTSGTQPEKSPPTPAKPRQPEPSLDDLLGLPRAKPADKPADKPTPVTPPANSPAPSDKPPSSPPTDPSKAELERQLSSKEVNDLFDEAVTTMDQTAVRLTSSGDTGIDTQRMQEDVVRKLDTLIDQAKKQQQKKKSKSKSKQNQKQEQDQQQQQQQQQSSQRNQGQSPTSSDAADGPPRAEGAGRASPGGSAAWGNLPAHVRDALSQGMDDRYSSIYKSLTEKYYKRLAEEPKPGDLSPAPAPTPKPTQ